MKNNGGPSLNPNSCTSVGLEGTAMHPCAAGPLCEYLLLLPEYTYPVSLFHQIKFHCFIKDTLKWNCGFHFPAASVWQWGIQWPLWQSVATALICSEIPAVSSSTVFARLVQMSKQWKWQIISYRCYKKRVDLKAPLKGFKGPQEFYNLRITAKDHNLI